MGILILVLAANWAATLWRSSSFLWVAFACLLGSALLPLAYPLSNLLYVENSAIRFVLASLLNFSPIFFANMVFSIRFAEQNVPEELFGWNLLGAVIGGALEYSSIAIGYQGMALVVVGLYSVVLACVWLDKRAQQT